jgi:multidrug efflux pump subunit AcrB
MKKELTNWKNFLAETEKNVQDRYESTFYLAIQQSKDIDRTDVTNQMRAIPEVTTVYREREVSTSQSQFVGEYIIRFILPREQSANKYYDNELKPRLNRIRGVKIQRDFGFEKLESY